MNECDIILLHITSISEWQNYTIQLYLPSVSFARRIFLFVCLFYYFLGFFERLAYRSVVSSYLTLVVTVHQVHHISVSALTLDDAIMVFNAKHEVHLWEGRIEDGGEECHNERLLLLKKLQ